MAIRYSRLVGHETLKSECIRWTKSHLPLTFLKQQIVLLAIVSSSLLLLILTTFFTPNTEFDRLKELPRELEFGAIVDCGSSGTRAHIFTWKNDGRRVTDIDLFRDADNKPFNKHISPGLSSLRNEPEKASEYMEPVMDFIRDTIPQDRHYTAPVYFMATAGMRLLEDSIQKRILSDITRDLKIKYDFPKLKSQVITGEYEGVYSWLSLNMNKVYNNSDSSRSIGMIEMGGASLQVTFEIKPEIELAIINGLKNEAAISTFRNEQINLDLNNNASIKLFATTFLGLGVNSARESAIDLLVRDYLEGVRQLGEKLDLANYQVSLKDPCLTMGSIEQTMRPGELITSKEQSVGFNLKKHGDAFKVILEGTGNFLNCLTLLERVIKTIKSERLNCIPSKTTCPMDLLGTSFIPYAHYPFVGLSEIFFTTNEMMHSAGIFNRTHVLQETNRICSTRYDKLKEIYSHSVSYEDRILYECFKASWLLTILHNSGLKMPVTYDNFRTLDRWNDQEIDWTFGAMLWELELNGARIK